MNDIQLLTVLVNVTTELASGRKSEADNTSSYSDLTSWRIHPEFLKTARGTYLAVMILPFLGLNPFQELQLKEQILKICHKRNYEGQWNSVRKLLTEIKLNPKDFFLEYFETHSTNELFGNDIKTMKKIWKTLQARNPYMPSRTPVKYPKRKRGYDDKGHLSGDSHGAKISVPDTRIPLRIEDLQPTNHLWFETLDRNKQQQGTIGGETTSRKEDPQNERKTNSTSDRNDKRKDRKTEITKEISPRFNWNNSAGQAIILASYVHALTRHKKRWEFWLKPEFLLFYAWKMHGKDLKYYSFVPKSLPAKYKEILSVEISYNRPIGSYSIRELNELFKHI